MTPRRPRFLDANILLRYFTASDPEKAQRAKRLLEQVEQGAEKVSTSIVVVFETVFTLQRTYKVPKAQIREMIQDVLALSAVQLPRKDLCFQALALYVEKNVSFVDAYIAVSMLDRELSEIYSWDADFDKLPGITRVEPDGEQAERRVPVP